MNLLKKAVLMKRKRLNWAVCRKQNGKTFFIHDIDEETGAILWCAAARRAVKFRTERGCQLFIEKTIQRKDVYVGRVAAKDKV